MSDDKIYDVPAEWTQRATINEPKYHEMYERSVADPNGFWAEQAKRITWMTPFRKVKNTSFGPGNVSIKWLGRHPERRLQLHRPPSARARQPDRDHLGGRRSFAVQAHHLPRASRRSLQDGQHPADP